jgi:hypothetical protein
MVERDEAAQAPEDPAEWKRVGHNIVSFRQEWVGRSRRLAGSSGFARVARLPCSHVEQQALEAGIG